MQEAVIFRRREQLKNSFVPVSHVLLCGYLSVSDGAKITFQVISNFDWESKETRDGSGFVHPAVETIAHIRHMSVRTIQRHILELTNARLLMRVRQRNKPSILYIEAVSEEETNKFSLLFHKEKNRININC